MTRVWRCTIAVHVEGDVAAVDAAVEAFKQDLLQGGVAVRQCAVEAHSVADLTPKAVPPGVPPEPVPDTMGTPEVDEGTGH